MGEKATESDLWQAFVSEIERVAADLGVLPLEVPRDVFVDTSPLGKRYTRFGTWTQARRKAAAELGGVDMPETPVPLPALPDEERPVGVETSTLVDETGAVRLQWIKTRSVRESRMAALERLLRELPDFIIPREETIDPPRHECDEDLLAVYPWGDPHLGMLAWEPETGEDWNLHKSERHHRAAIDVLAESGPKTRRAIFAPLGDLLHADDPSAQTKRAGHSLDVDSRWIKVVESAIRLICYGIDRLLEHHESVALENLAGNHDDNSALAVSIAVAEHYANEPRVQISRSPAIHRYHRFGSVLLGFTHGHTHKPEKLPEIMACDRPEDWGQTKWRHWITGHIHQTKRFERPGCIVEAFRTLAPKEAYAAAAGYRTGRDAHRIVYHRHGGEVSRSLVSAAYIEHLLGEAAA